MKKIIAVLLISISLGKAQTKCKSGLIDSSADIKSGKYNEMAVKRIHHALWSDSIIVNTHTEKFIFSSEKIWGYRDKDCMVYRNYADDFYKLEQAGGMVIYSQSLSPFGDFVFTFYFFSKTLDSPIFKLTHKNLVKEFAGNKCFLEEVEKKIKWYEDYSTVDRKKHIYKIIELYNDCNGK